jgi:hypothetical protein
VQIFSKLYHKTLEWAQSKHAVYWLSLISFIESFILPYPPPDVLLAPMVLKKPEKAYQFISQALPSFLTKNATKKNRAPLANNDISINGKNAILHCIRSVVC